MIEETIINKIDEVNEEYNIIVKNSPDNGYKLNDINILAHQREAMNKVLNELLIEIKNQPDYKSAWNELKNQPTNYITKYLDKFGFVEEKTLNKLIEELEQKYNLGGE